MKDIVTVKQALVLRELGYKEPTLRYAYGIGSYRLQKQRTTTTINYCKAILSVPSVDQAIDWLRRKFNIIIFDFADPFVDPIKNAIVYCYGVKLCNKKWGWNQRKYIGQSNWSRNPYAIKRQAIWIALHHIVKIKKDAANRRNSKNRRRKLQSNSNKPKRAVVRMLRS